MMEKFSEETAEKEIVILDIPDEYQFMDPELMEDLQTKVDHYLENRWL